MRVMMRTGTLIGRTGQIQDNLTTDEFEDGLDSGEAVNGRWAM